MEKTKECICNGKCKDNDCKCNELEISRVGDNDDGLVAEED